MTLRPKDGQPIIESGKQAPKKERESTLIMPADEPKLESYGFMQACLRIHTLRQYLSGFQLLESFDPRGFRFEAFRENIAGIRNVTLSGSEFQFVCTGGGIYFLSNEHGALLRLADETRLDIMKFSRITDGRETLTICRITGPEMDAILEKARTGNGHRNDGLEPASVDENVRRAEFAAKLKGCQALFCAEGFDIARFADSITLVSVFNDDENRLHYAIAGEGDAPYTMYVNRDRQEHKDNPLVFIGKLGEDTCHIYVSEVVG
ncbi:MAG: hypothetical protein AB1324_02460 [Candidatus Micrarchaeota archaeon]